MNIEVSRERLEPRLLNDVITEDSAATEFIERHGQDLRYCHTTGAWFIFDITHWKKDETGHAFQLAREIARDLSEDQDQSRRFSMNKTAFCSGIERFARGDTLVAVISDYWDADPWLLGTPGGTVDLRTGELRDSSRHDAITKLTAVAPLDEECPRWLKFLDDATGGDKEFVRFLQQWCGYCLTGVTHEHALVFVYGPGGNGKSVFLNVVSFIFGDYAKTAAMDTFTAGHSDKHPTDLAMLRGARLVTASETESGRPWAESRIKQLTGGDTIAARFMRQDFFEYKPQFKLIVVGNHMPDLNNVDDAAKRRFNIAPFILTPAMPDHRLEEKLQREAGAILSWMIRGCLDWQSNGLVRPESVQAATKAYFLDQDLMGQWLEDQWDVRIGHPDHWDRSSDLFQAWSSFCLKAGESSGSKKKFGSAMRKRGFLLDRGPDGSRVIRFVRLKPEVDP